MPQLCTPDHHLPKGAAVLRDLYVKLTDAERIQRGDEIGREVNKHALLETEKKASAQDYAEKIRSCDLRIGQLGRIAETGEELRPVECHESPNNERRTMEIIRDDTGEVVESRPM